MDCLTCVGVVVLIIIGFCVLVLILDADLTTSFYDKWAADLSGYYQGKVVWITGASSGIGAALAVESAKLGAKLVLSARRVDALEAVKTKCLKESQHVGMTDTDILVLPLDMCDFDAHEKAAQQVLDHFGVIDILVNNAGRSQRARWEHIDIEVDRSMFELNVFSVINLTRIVFPHMASRGSGCIAVMSSVAGKLGVPFSGTYTATKHAIHGYFESLRTEKVKSGVDVCLLCPGPTFSDILSSAATEKVGEQLGGEMSVTDRRMTAVRCARLSLVAMAFRLAESWICFVPVLPFLYVNQYAPSIGNMLRRTLGAKFSAKVRDSKDSMDSDKFK